MLSLTLFTIWLAASAFAGHHSQFSKRHESLARRNATIAQRGALTGASNAPLTYYETGLGACGQVNNDNQFIVALNTQDYGTGYPGPFCHLTIVIQYNGIQARATIMDECPGCHTHGDHGLDLSPALFQHFASEGAGVLYATWWFDGGYDAAGNGPSQDIGGGETTTSSTYKPTSTYVPPPPPPPTSTSTSTTWSETPTTTSTSKTSTSTTVESTSTTTSKTSTSITSTSTTSTTSSAPTPSVPASSPSDGETIESIFKAFVYMNAMIAFSSTSN